MKFFVDLSKKQLIKSSASNVALERIVLKRRDSLAVEVVFVTRNAVATMPSGTTVSVALKRTFADSNFLASASGTPPILNLNTVPLEDLFTATAPSAIPALLEIRWTVPGETTRTATLTAEVQNSVILGTEGTPEAIPDLKATQTEAQAGTNNEKWMTPLRTAQAIAAWVASNLSWSTLTGKPSTFPPSAHTHATSEVTGLDQNLASLEAADAALDARIDYISANLDPAALDSIAEAAASINSLQNQLDTHTHTAADITDFATAVVAVSPPVDWSSLTGKPTEFPPEAHTHAQSEITGLESALGSKASLAQLAALESSLGTLSQQNADAASITGGTAYFDTLEAATADADAEGTLTISATGDILGSGTNRLLGFVAGGATY